MHKPSNTVAVPVSRLEPRASPCLLHSPHSRTLAGRKGVNTSVAAMVMAMSISEYTVYRSGPSDGAIA